MYKDFCEKCWQEIDEELARSEMVAYDAGHNDGFKEGREFEQLKLKSYLQDFAQWLWDNEFLVPEAFTIRLVDMYIEEK